MRIGALAVLPQKKNAVSVLIFKTNISSKKEAAKVAKLLDAEDDILRWNIDRQDIDRVLRIEAINLGKQKIISIIQKAGFICEELAD